MDYIHIEDSVIDDGPRSLPVSWRDAKGTRRLERATKAELKGFGWLPVVYVNEDHDVTVQVRTELTGCNIGDTVPEGADTVTGIYTVRDKIVQELAVEQRNRDLADLREAGKDMALVLTELVDWILANTTMKPTDFSPNVKQAYLGLKAIADRVKG